MDYFRNKNVLLTGATGGFGSELVKQLSASGAHLVLTDLRSPAEALPEGVLRFYEADLSTKDGCLHLCRQCDDDGQTIDILINNAGLAYVGEFFEIPDDKWEKVIQVNLLAPMYLARFFVKGMIARRQGHIVNFSSVGGHVATPLVASYAVSKFGIRGFGAAIGPELKPYGIFVSDVFPSFTRTPILRSERIGKFSDRPLPEFLLDEPGPVVANVLAAVARKESQIFPSFRARTGKALADFSQTLASNLAHELYKYVGK